jgi:endoglucanase
MPFSRRTALKLLAATIPATLLPRAVAQTRPATASRPAPKILLNTLGYLPDAPKRATLTVPTTTFSLVRTTDNIRVFTGATTGPARNADTNEQLFTADFSAFTTPGTYRLVVEGAGESVPFPIGPDVYNAAFALVTRAMYLARCGTAVSATVDGATYHYDACHTDDAYLDLITGRHDKHTGTGGWHDAGDYNKYVVNTAISLGCLFRAWEDFQDRLKTFPLQLPESRGKLPDFLAEIKWGADWVLTMQAPDGGVYTKLTTKDFGGFILPDRETAPRFVTPVSSSATADLVAIAALAARHFRPYDAAYADKCLAAARKSYDWLQAHPADLRPQQAGTTTGGYGTTDPDDRLWAAAELWETTGDPVVLKDLEARLAAARNLADVNWDWGNVANLGTFTYVLSAREGRNADLLARVRNAVVASADRIVATAKAHGYGRPLGTVYYWGCNGTVARQCVNLTVANRLAPRAEYRATCLEAIGYLFGRNPLGRSFVTGVGYLPPLHPHHRPSGGDSNAVPWPGYLVGGPHPGARDWFDVQDDYRTNEVAINWQTALIYALAGFVG